MTGAVAIDGYKVEIVADLGDLDRELDAARVKTKRAAADMTSSFDKIEAAQKRAAGAAHVSTTASDRLAMAHDKATKAAAGYSGITGRLVAEQMRVSQAFNDNARAADLATAASQRLGQGFNLLGTNSLAAGGSVGRLASSLGVLGGIGIAAAVLSAARGIMQAGDEFTSYRNKLIVAGESQQTLNQRLDELVGIALRSRTALGPVMELYGGIRKSTEDLGKSQADVQRVTETISKAFAASGTSAATAAGAILQLNQAFASGTLRGEELNSVLEGAPALARLIAKEFGIGMGELKSFGEEGKLSADRVFNAFLAGSKEVDTTFNATATTISQASANAGTSLTQLGADLDNLVGFAQKAVAGLNAVAGAIQGVAARVRSFQEGVQQARMDNLANTIKELESTEIPFLTSARDTQGLKQATENLARFRAEYDKMVGARIDGMVGKPPDIMLNAEGMLTTARATRTAQKAMEDLAKTETDVARGAMSTLEKSIADANKAFADRAKVAAQMRADGVENGKVLEYEARSQKVLTDQIKQANAAAASKGGGGGRSAGESSGTDGFDSMIQRYRDQTAELKLQQEQASKTGEEFYKLQATHRLYQAALKAGRQDEEGLADRIATIADAFAKQQVATNAAIDAQQRFNESVRYASDLVSTFAEDVLSGSLESALKSLGKSYLSASLDALVSGKGPLAAISGMAGTKDQQGGFIGMLMGLPKAVQAGAQKGSQTGTTTGILAINQEGTNFLGGALGIDSKMLAGGLTAIAGLGAAYGIGASAGSMGQAVGGGAISGLMGGAGLATALGATGAMSMMLPGIGLVIGAGLAPIGNRSINRKELLRERAKRLGK